MRSRCLLLVITAALTFTSLAKADLATGAVSYWPLDEIDGSGPFTTPDYAFTNVVTLVGGITLTNGESAQLTNAFYFPASPTSYFTTAGTGVTPSGLPIFKSPGGYTVAMWVKAAAQTTRYLYTESSNAPNQIFGIGTGTTAGVAGKIDLFIRVDAGTALVNHTNSQAVVFDNTWHHIAFTSDTHAGLNNNATNVLYVDGRVDTNFTYKIAGTMTLSTTTVGNLVRTNLGAAFNGTIDDVAVWSRVLSQAEVQQFMSNSIPLPIVQSKPTISSISPSSTNVLGDYVFLNVNAVGSAPINYQWYLAGSPLANQTSNSLPITTLNSPGTYVYSVVSANYLGSITNVINVVVPADPANNITSNLVSYWPLDNTATGSAVTTPDLYGHDDFTLNGTNGNIPTLITGEFSNGLGFDATQLQYGRSIGGVPVFNYTNYSVSVWVNGNPQSQLRVFASSSTNNATPLFSIGTDPTAFLSGASIYVRNDANSVMINNLTSAGTVFDGNWHHIVWVDQNGHALLYVDGVLDTVSYSYLRTGTYSLNTTAIGAIVRSSVGNYYTGGIDDVAVWNRRLTYTEIQALQTGTIPAPTSISPPNIFSLTNSPVDPTNNLYVGDTLSFTAQVGGTAPIAYQWFKNGVAIPSATGSQLVISNAQTTDSGTYTLTASNGDATLPGGADVTSTGIQATVKAYTPVTNGLAFAVDVDALGSPNIQPGFVEYNSSLAGFGLTNGIKMTIIPVATTTALADRLRTTAPNAVFNGPGMTQAQLYNDFLYDASTVTNTGLNILIERLATNVTYGVTIWSFDPSSLLNRISDWTDLTSGTPVVIKTGYTFNGSILPTADYDDTLGALITSSATGKIQIQAVNDPANVNGVASFINAIQLVANPKVVITAASMVADGNFQITAQSQYPGEPITLMSSATLAPANWQAVTNSTVIATHGPMTTFEVPPTATQLFFRAVATH